MAEYSGSAVGLVDTGGMLFDSVLNPIYNLAGLQIHFDERGISKLGDSDNCTSWGKSGGAGNFHLVYGVGQQNKYRAVQHRFPMVATDNTSPRTLGMKETGNTDAMTAGANEALMVVVVYTPSVLNDASIFCVCGSGANSAGNGSFRGWDFYQDTDNDLTFRMRNSSGTQRACTGTDNLLGLVNTPIVVIGVREYSTNKHHLWVNGNYDSLTVTGLGSENFKSSSGDFNLMSLADGGSTAWTLPGAFGEMACAVSTTEYTNSQVNKIGEYLSRKWATTPWVAATQLAS